MRGSVFRQCWCRDPETRKRYGKGRCPKLAKSKTHGRWYARYDSKTENRRQPVLGPFDTRAEAEEELARAITRAGGRGPDRSLRLSAYLDAWLEGKRQLKASTRESYEEAFRLYWKPALGALRLVDVRDAQVSEVVTEMLRINRPQPSGSKPSEMMLRMTAARADDERRRLPDGEQRHKKSPKPLSAARIERMFAPFRAAMNTAVVTRKIDISPCMGVELPRPDKVRPLAWTAPRVARFRTAHAKRQKAAEGGRRTMAEAESVAVWADPGLRPCPVMVWMPDHTGRFLDYLDETGERFAALFYIAAYCGLRRDEIAGLAWTEVDLDQGSLTVRETASGEGPKSDAGTRDVPIPAPAVPVLRAWHDRQLLEHLEWGRDWEGDGRVFTWEAGAPVGEEWISTRFRILAFRAGLPPVRLHDLRHGTASLLKAAGEDTRVISAILGHAKTSFTDAVYVNVFPEVASAAAERAAAIVPRKVRHTDPEDGSG